MVTAALVAECGARPRPLPSAKEVGKGVLQEGTLAFGASLLYVTADTHLPAPGEHRSFPDITRAT